MKNFKAIAGILLVFILGAAGGALVTNMIHEARLQRFISGGHSIREEVIVDRLTKKLDLDSRQQEEVRVIVHETHDGIHQVRSSIHPQIEAMLTAGQDRIKTVLRPDQREKFDKIIAERKQREASKGKQGHEQ